jgi:hypothetical protein
LGVIKEKHPKFLPVDIGVGMIPVGMKPKDLYKVKKLELKDWINIFCVGIAGIDDSQLDILAPSSVEVVGLQSTSVIITEDDEDNLNMDPQDFINSTVYSFGVYLDIQNKTCFVRLLNNQTFLDNLKKGVCKQSGTYALKFINFDTPDKIPVLYTTAFFVDGKDVPSIQMMFNQLGALV